MNTRFGYLQARLQARYAKLPDESRWLHLAGLKELASFLEELRNSPLSAWITGLSAASSPEDIEKYLHKCLLDTIREIAGWFSPSWSATIHSFETLLQLPAIDYLSRSEAAGTENIEDDELLELLQTGKQGDELLNAWISGWRALWPQMSGSHHQAIDSLIEMLQQHRLQFVDIPVRKAWETRHALEYRLRFFFRRHELQPAAAFAYLALVALMLERLRAELLQRALFSGPVTVAEGEA